MATPVGENILVDSGFRDCYVSMCGRDTVVDLMLLEMSEFDVILGMDWLVSCHMTLDFHHKVIKFSMHGERDFIFQGDWSEVPNNLISMLCAR